MAYVGLEGQELINAVTSFDYGLLLLGHGFSILCLSKLSRGCFEQSVGLGKA